MANEEHLRILKKGVEIWNSWRSDSPGERPDLVGADLGGANLKGANLSMVNLNKAILSGAILEEAELGWSFIEQAILFEVNLIGASLHETSFYRSYLPGANLERAQLVNANCESTDFGKAKLDAANLFRANFEGANLNNASLSARANLSATSFKGANLSGANLKMAIINEADFTWANFQGADLEKAVLFEAVFNNVNLSNAQNLDLCVHHGPSCVDHRTLMMSEGVPLIFWRGCGLPDALIDYMPSLSSEAIQFYSCFISYSSKDQEFADRLHADLQNAGVRCWFAPHDLEIGEKVWDGLDEAIRMRDKVVLILSHDAIASDWVEDEVTTAFEEERQRSETMLFPIRLDDAVMDTDEAWAAKLRSRNIGDFSRWKDHDAYKAMLDRVLRDLKAGP